MWLGTLSCGVSWQPWGTGWPNVAPTSCSACGEGNTCVGDMQGELQPGKDIAVGQQVQVGFVDVLLCTTGRC